MKVRLIVTDLDGTLLHTDKTISAYTAGVLARCRKKGILTAIATARSEDSAIRIINAVQPDIVISNGGGMVRAGEKILYLRLLSAPAIEVIVKGLLRRNAVKNFTLSCPGGYYVSYQSEANHPDYAHGVYRDFTKPITEDAYKISAELTDRSAVPALMEELPDCSFMAYAGDDWCSFAHKEARKGLAVGALAEQMHIPLEEIAAFGDDYNDVEMLRLCGTGVAMENAVAEAKAAAKFVCGHNDADGAAHWIETNLL